MSPQIERASDTASSSEAVGIVPPKTTARHPPTLDGGAVRPWPAAKKRPPAVLPYERDRLRLPLRRACLPYERDRYGHGETAPASVSPPLSTLGNKATGEQYPRRMFAGSATVAAPLSVAYPRDLAPRISGGSPRGTAARNTENPYNGRALLRVSIDVG